MRSEAEIRDKIADVEKRREAFRQELGRLAYERGDGVEDAMLLCHARMSTMDGIAVGLYWVLEAHPGQTRTDRPSGA